MSNPERIREPTHNEIATCAYLIWEREGCPLGRDQEIWQQAETQLRATLAHETWVFGSDGAEEHKPDIAR
jgi:DUF2934 family protein